MEGLKKAGRIGQILMGLVFLVAGIAKVWEPILFYWESLPYAQILGFEKEALFLVAKIGVIFAPIECLVGVALIANWRPKLTMPVATAMMAFFFVLAINAWRQGLVSNCGCFGSLVERTPAESAVENGLMLAVLLFAWWKVRELETVAWAGRAVLIGGLAAFVVTGIRFFPNTDRMAQSDLQQGQTLTRLSLKGVDLDLSQGEYLIELFSPTCGHCKQAVPKVNELADSQSLPTVVALHGFEETHQAVNDFKQHLKPRYQIASISLVDFRRLTWGHRYPRFAHIKDGVVQKVWEADLMPTASQLEEYFGREKHENDQG